MPATKSAPSKRSRKTKPPTYQQSSTGWLNFKPVAGVTVNADTALTSSAVYRAVTILSQSFGVCPWKLFEEQEDGGKKYLRDHSVNDLLLRQPNKEQTPMMFKEGMQTTLSLWGNACAEIERNSTNNVAMNLWPLHPKYIILRRNSQTRRLEYLYRGESGVEVIIQPENMFHVALMGDGLWGKSTVTLFREAIGMGKAAEQFGSAFFGNGATPSLALKHPGKLSAPAQKNLRDAWNETHQGSEKAHRVAILEEGMTVEKIGMPLEDAQFLEMRQFQVVEIARIFGVPPHLLGDLTNAHFTNIEHQGIDFVTHTLLGLFKRWEEEADRKLLRAMVGQYTKIDVRAFLRGDTPTRYAAHATGRQWGWLSVNDIRRLEDLDPLPADEGDVYLSPANMVPTDKLADMPAPGSEPPAPKGQGGKDNEPKPKRTLTEGTSLRPIVRDAFRRLVFRETDNLKRIATKTSIGKLHEAVVAFYCRHKDDMLETLESVAVVMGTSDRYADVVHAIVSDANMTLSSAPDAATMRVTLLEWEETRIDELTDRYMKELCHAERN